MQNRRQSETNTFASELHWKLRRRARVIDDDYAEKAQARIEELKKAADGFDFDAMKFSLANVDRCKTYA